MNHAHRHEDRGPASDATEQFALAPNTEPHAIAPDTTELVPVQRPASSLPAAVAAAVSFIAAFGLYKAAGDGVATSIAVAVCQLLLLAVWRCMARVDALGISIVGGLTALGGGLVAAQQEPSYALGLILAAGFGLAIIVQLSKASHRHAVTASLAIATCVSAAMVGLSALALLVRLDGGAELARTSIVAAGAALVAAHLLDALILSPRLTAAVPRGVVGTIAGLIVGTLAGVLAHMQLADGEIITSLSPGVAGLIVGAATAIAVLVIDLAVSYSLASESETRPASTLGILASSGLPPLAGFAIVGTIGYILGPVLEQW